MARPRKVEIEDVRLRAMNAFWQDGYAGTSLAKLEQATDIGRRSLFNIFQDKLTLFVEILRDFRGLAGSRYLAAMEVDGAGLDAIDETFRLLIAEARTKNGRLGCLICNTARDPIARDKRVHREVWLYFFRIEKAFEKALKGAVKAGDIDDKTDITGRAQFLLSSVVSICTLARAGARPEMLETIASQAMADLK